MVQCSLSTKFSMDTRNNLLCHQARQGTILYKDTGDEQKNAKKLKTDI
jgi:hypothetical protein